jgi:hypothetical protein
MRTLLFLTFLLFFACQADAPQADETTVQAPAETVTPDPLTESGQPLAAQEQTIIQTQRVYLGWHLTTASGAIQKTGGTWLLTKAFLPVPAGQTADPAQLINDLIRQLAGILSGVDLTATSKNWLIITSSSLPGLRETMVLDSRNRLSKPSTK